jgi:hypothetical protein
MKAGFTVVDADGHVLGLNAIRLEGGLILAVPANAAFADAVERLAREREYATLFAVSNNEAFFRSRGYAPREIPELDRERSEVSRFKGVYAKELGRR